jgi:hypothetical protein
MNWIEPETQTDGSMVTLDSDGPSVSFEIEGLYKGDLAVQKLPKYTAVFKFELVMI